MSFLLDKKSKIRRESKDQRIKADIIGPIAQSGRFPAMSAVARAPRPVEGGRKPGWKRGGVILWDFGFLYNFAIYNEHRAFIKKQITLIA